MKPSRAAIVTITLICIVLFALWWFVLGSYPQITLAGKTRQEAVREAMARWNRDSQAPSKTRMNFYGRVIDENGQPIAEAGVVFAWRGMFADARKKTTSDADGRFSLTGERGETLSVYLKKEGYYVPKALKQTHFEFFDPGNAVTSDSGSIVYNQSDPQHPFVFQIRGMHESPDILKQSVSIFPPPDGTLVTFDFFTGELAAEDKVGQMEIKTQKEKTLPRSDGHFYPTDWRVVLNIPEGGFASSGTTGEFAFEAPVAGYKPTMDWALHATGPLAGGNSSLEKTLYFCFGEPKRYGRLYFTTEASLKRVNIQYVINQKPGDRNLEAYPTEP